MKTYQIADLFCGAGGTSSGAIEAIETTTGRPAALTAVNHWPVAIETHLLNHPGARHLCTGIDQVNPRTLFGDGELDMLWASPECTHHSVARGGRPMNDQSRATAWCVVRWADALRPSVILVENVPEFLGWGPLNAKGKPIASKKGSIFRAWLANLEAIGYRVDYRILCAADYGDPTTRRRLFVQAVRGRRKIVWPNPTHSPSTDVDLFGPRKPWRPAREIIDWSIPSTSIYERKKPLSPKTLARIEAGLKKFGLGPYLVTTSHTNSGKVNAANWNAHDIESPMGSVTGATEKALVQPYIVAWDHQSGTGQWSADEPLSTVTSKARHGVVEPFIVEFRGTNERQVQNSARSVEEPCGTVTAGGRHHALIEPFLVKTANGESRNGEASRTRSLDEPAPTICGNRGDLGLIEPCLLGQQSGAAMRPVSEPTPTVATAGAIGLIEPFLVSYYGNGQAHSTTDPVPTVTTNDRFGLARPEIVHDGKRYLLDIRFRMLQPHELAAAQGFPDGYRFAGTKTEVVKQIGNAVPRRLARAIVASAITQRSDISGLFPD